MIINLNMNPPRTTAQMKGLNKKTGTIYTKANVQALMDEYVARLAPFAPKTPIEGPVSVTVLFEYAVDSTHRVGEYKTTKPDCDNAVKLLLDALTKCRFFTDDAQIAVLSVTKFYVEKDNACIRLCVKEAKDL